MEQRGIVRALPERFEEARQCPIKCISAFVRRYHQDGAQGDMYNYLAFCTQAPPVAHMNLRAIRQLAGLTELREPEDQS